MGEHNPFGKSGGTGSILHVADIVFIDGVRAALYGFDRGLTGKGESLVPAVTSLLSGFYGNDIAQEGQTLDMQRAAFGRCFKLGA